MPAQTLVLALASHLTAYWYALETQSNEGWASYYAPGFERFKGSCFGM